MAVRVSSAAEFWPLCRGADRDLRKGAVGGATNRAPCWRTSARVEDVRGDGGSRGGGGWSVARTHSRLACGSTVRPGTIVIDCVCLAGGAQGCDGGRCIQVGSERSGDADPVHAEGTRSAPRRRRSGDRLPPWSRIWHGWWWTCRRSSLDSRGCIGHRGPRCNRHAGSGWWSGGPERTRSRRCSAHRRGPVGMFAVSRPDGLMAVYHNPAGDRAGPGRWLVACGAAARRMPRAHRRCATRRR